MSDLHMHKPCLQHVDPPDLYSPGSREDDPATPTFNEATGDFLAVWRTAPDGTPHTVRAS